MTTAAADLRLITPPASPTEPADLDPRGVRHSPQVKEVAFSCWLEANGNAERARRLLVEEFPKYDLNGEQVPSARIIRYWSQHEGWEIEFNRAVGLGFGHLLKLHANRKARIHGQALDVMDEVTSPGYIPTKEDKIRVDAARAIIADMTATVAHYLQAEADQEADDEQEFADATEANRHWIRGNRGD